MPYHTHDSFQKNTYSRKRVRAKNEVSSLDSEFDDFPRKKKLREDIAFVTSAIQKAHYSPKTPKSKLDLSPALLVSSRVAGDTQANPRPGSTTSKLSVESVDLRTALCDNSKKSTAGIPGPSSRTQSQHQKENRHIALTDLASPYKGVSSKTPVLLSSSNRVSKFFRRPSVDTTSTHIPVAFHRRSSGSHALQNKSKNYDNNWIIPFLPLASLPALATKCKSNQKFVSLDIANSHLQFSPQMCSTPVRKKTCSLQNDTPDWTASPGLGSKQTSDIIMKDEAVVQKDSVDLVSYAPTASETDVAQPATVQNSNDTIRPNNLTLAISFPSSSSPDLNNDTIDKQPSYEPDSINLRKMFSGLDLTEYSEKPTPQGFANEATSHKAKRAKLVVEIPKKTVRFNARVSSSKEKKSVQAHKMKNKIYSRQYRSTPPRIVIDNRPLTVDGDDEDDELLLTSKGWDWDPRHVFLELVGLDAKSSKKDTSRLTLRFLLDRRERRETGRTSITICYRILIVNQSRPLLRQKFY